MDKPVYWAVALFTSVNLSVMGLIGSALLDIRSTVRHIDESHSQRLNTIEKDLIRLKL